MVRQQLSDDELIAAYLEPNPHKPGLDEYRLKDAGVPVWALIGYLPVVAGDHERLAETYAVPVEAVDAAIAFYERHRDSIDARLDANLLVDGNDATVPLRA